MTSYFAKQLFDGTQLYSNARITVQDACISVIEFDVSFQSTEDIYLDGIVTAGFIDTQVNGGGGVLFNHDTSLNTLNQMMHGHSQFGTTSMLPTLITDSSEKMRTAADSVSQAIEEQLPGIEGIHFEGPHLSIPKKGIHPSHHVRALSDSDLALFQRKDLGKILLTVAPETVPPDVIQELVEAGVVVALGHSAASLECVLTAIEAGATGFTHLFNAMSGLTAREPGMIAAALMDNRITAGLIADLHHVHSYNCQLAYKCLGPERLMLVTDAMAHVGSPLKSIPWQDTQIIRDGDKLTLEDGSLAGSCLDMIGAVRNMHHILSGQLEACLNMASRAPANFLSLSQLGELKVGKRANFVLLDSNVQTTGTWINGKQVAGDPITNLDTQI